jgi:hypothetical protein
MNVWGILYFLGIAALVVISLKLTIGRDIKWRKHP